MSNTIKIKENSSNAISKVYSIPLKNNSNSNISPIDIENSNSSARIILRNAGKELLQEKYLTTEEKSNNCLSSQSIINLKHKGIKRKGHSLYDPYLIKVCKNAIINEKKELPNYKEIITKINTEYGIEDEKFNENNLYKKKDFNNSNNFQNDISSFNNSNNILNVNDSAMSTNVIEKRYKNIFYLFYF